MPKTLSVKGERTIHLSAAERDQLRNALFTVRELGLHCPEAMAVVGPLERTLDRVTEDGKKLVYSPAAAPAPKKP